MTDEIDTKPRPERILFAIGGVASLVVCIYAVMLGLLNVIGSAAEPLFLLFYFLMPLPFYVRKTLARMQDGVEPPNARGFEHPALILATAGLGLAIALGLGIWMSIEYVDWTSKGKSLGPLEYIAAGLPINLLIASSALLALLFKRRNLP